MGKLSKYEPIAEAIAKLFHLYVEVVLHEPKTNRIVSIFNNFSRRMPGEDSSLEDLEGLLNGPTNVWKQKSAQEIFDKSHCSRD